MAENIEGKSTPAAAPQRFQQVDADAVCEQCGTVNDDGTLLCHVCGQNLRDQRARRLARAQAPATIESKVNRVRIFTGLLSLLGILIVVLAVVNLGRIEAGLVNVLSEDSAATPGTEALWSGPSALIFEELATELRDYPSSNLQVQDALDNPVAETSYNGRYVLIQPGPVTRDRVAGEAALRKRGNRVYFVAFMRRPQMEVRGYADIEDLNVAGAAVQGLVARGTAGYVSETGTEVRGFGLTEPIEAGGHRVMAMEAGESAEASNRQTELFAYRIR